MSDEGSSVSNAITDEAIQGIFSEAFLVLEELDSMKGAYMAACKEKREALKDIKDQAKESGIPKKVFAAVLARRAAELKIERIDSGLEEADDVSIYERTLNVLGPFADTPLGQAAVDEAKAQDDAKVVPIRGRRVAENVAALEGADGIQQL
jgi:hypothetical protein